MADIRIDTTIHDMRLMKVEFDMQDISFAFESNSGQNSPRKLLAKSVNCFKSSGCNIEAIAARIEFENIGEKDIPSLRALFDEIPQVIFDKFNSAEYILLSVEFHAGFRFICVCEDWILS